MNDYENAYNTSLYYYKKAQHEYDERIHNFLDNMTYFERLINETKENLS